MRLHLCLIALACTLAACGGTAEPAAANTALAGAPKWVTSDCRRHFGDTPEPVICGVGAVSDVSSPTLARNAAMGRGRTEIARYLEVRIKSILTDYQAQAGGVSEQTIEENTKQITDVTLSGTRMAENWVAPDGTYYALMTLGLTDFTNSVEAVPGISESVRQVILQNATKAFAVHDDETSRY
jgi:hypothetical protein